MGTLSIFDHNAHVLFDPSVINYFVLCTFSVYSNIDLNILKKTYSNSYISCGIHNSKKFI